MKPIGYWLNHTDKALTAYMNGMLAEFGLTRTAWQVLNVVRDTPGATDTDVHTALAANADATILAAAVDTVLADGWTARPVPGQLALTADGERRLASVDQRIDAFRELSTAGITLEEYRTAVRVLERMTRNLEGRRTVPYPAQSRPSPGPGKVFALALPLSEGTEHGWSRMWLPTVSGSLSCSGISRCC